MASPLQISTQICNGLPDLVYIKEARKAIAFMPLGALEINVQTVEIYNCLMVPFIEEKMPWYPCPYKNEAYMWMCRGRAVKSTKFKLWCF